MRERPAQVNAQKPNGIASHMKQLTARHIGILSDHLVTIRDIGRSEVTCIQAQHSSSHRTARNVMRKHLLLGPVYMAEF